MLLMSNPLLVPIVLGILFLVLFPVIVLLTKKSTILRKNFFRAIFAFVFPSLLMFSAVGTMSTLKPTRPTEESAQNSFSLEETNRKLIELQRYTEDVESHMEFTIQKLYLLIGIIWLLSLIPALSLGFNFIKHLEKSEDNEIERIL